MRMIFHHPLPVRPDAQAASGIRPFQMMEAFRSLGFEIDAVCGYSAERARAIDAVYRKLRQGVRYDFVYSESSTEPTLLTDRHHLPLHPLLDFGLFARAKTYRIPVGLFYRDVYWRFPGYAVHLPAWKRAVARMFYRYDLFQYARLVDRLYLPSMEMARHVPGIETGRFASLPPGFAGRSLPQRPSGRLRLLYVGGFGEHYRMHAVVRALADLSEVDLVICTRESEWLSARDDYPLPSAGNVRVVHCSGSQVDELLAESDIGVLCVEPQPYWKFAVPLKLYEYLGAEKPVLASAGTLAAEFTIAQGIGWSVPYDALQIGELLRRIAADRSILQQKIAALRRVKHEHTWQVRAHQVASDLVDLR
ncbi:MAG TPA: hypothetical protein VFU71_11030 [Burkholderiaceae bacterium]|nr:hypothetical protein [Burkholderiaceae bacterium]